MQFAVKLVTTAGFNGTTLLTPTPPATRFPPPGDDGVIVIDKGSDPIGLIDPDLSLTTGANQTLVLQSFLIEIDGGGSGGTDDTIEVVDDDPTTPRFAFEIKSLDGVATPYFSDQRWVIPVGYRLRVQGGGPAVLRLNFWTVASVAELAVAEPAVPT
jgi:hypothetical protein